MSARFLARSSVLLSPLFERASLMAADKIQGLLPESEFARSLYLCASTVSSSSLFFFGVCSGPESSSSLAANLGLSLSDDFFVNKAESTS